MLHGATSAQAAPDADGAPEGLTAAHRKAMVRQLPRFALCWIGTTALWNAVLVAERLVGPGTAALVLGLECAVLLLAFALCRRDPQGGRVVPVLAAACVLLGVTSTALFAAARASGDVLAFLLLTLYLASALFFAWGWRTELVVLAATVLAWLAAIPFLVFRTFAIELATAIVIGSVLSLAIAERAARTFRLAYLHRASEERSKRALEVSRDEAERARAEAEAATRAKDDFIATLSHELRSPLSAVLTWTHMLRRGLMEPARRDHALDVIERNARAQARLIEDLLDVSRIVSGKLRVELGRVDLRTVVRTVVETVRAAAEARGLTLAVELADHPIIVRGDATRLQQVIENLLSNAIKFTPEGGRVAVTARRVSAQAEVSVCDTGIGIPSERLVHIFERFEQAGGMINRRHGGLGLGLAIARHLVEVHGGTIEAESPGPRQGSIFRVRLPLGGEVEREPSGAGEAALCPPKPLPTLAGLRVLVVDDEPDARDFVTTLLSTCGAAVTPAASAREALEEVAERPPDVLVADLAMPGEDGYALIRKARMLERARGTHMRAIALTALAGAEDRRRAMSAGFDLHLVKPAEPGDVVAAVAGTVIEGAGRA